MIMKHICDDISYQEWKTKSISLLKHCSVDLYFFHLHKKMVTLPVGNRQRKHTKLSDMPFTTIILKVTHPFNVETHHM